VVVGLPGFVCHCVPPAGAHLLLEHLMAVTCWCSLTRLLDGTWHSVYNCNLNGAAWMFL
jgi:hypothetical protein